MLLVEVSLWPYGKSDSATRLATLKIMNDGTGDATIGNYVCEMQLKDDPEIKVFKVMKFRRSRGFLELIRTVLERYHRGEPARAIFQSREGAETFPNTA